MNRFKNILYVNDPSMDQSSALARAVSLAESNQAALTVLEVLQTGTYEVPAELMAKHARSIESLIDPYRQRLRIRSEVLKGPLFIEVIRAVLRNAHDLVIKTAENPDFLSRLFGSSDMHLLRKCPCPVWLMKPSERSRYKAILAAVDFDPLKPCPEEQALNQQILELSSSLALADAAALHLVHVWEPIAETILRSRGGNADEDIAAYLERERMNHQNALYRLSERLKEWIGADAYSKLSPAFHLLKGSARKVIARFAAELRVELVVMGTVARTGILGFFIGNTAEDILGQLECSVLAIKPPGFSTPVKLSE